MAGEPTGVTDDIYALGATIYDLMTSKPPFYSGNIIRQIQEKTAPSMAQRRKELGITGEEIPKEWEKTVAACLAKDPGERLQTAEEVVEWLSLKSEGEKPPRKITAVEITTSAFGSRRLVFSIKRLFVPIPILVVLALVFLFLLLFLFFYRPRVPDIAPRLEEKHSLSITSLESSKGDVAEHRHVEKTSAFSYVPPKGWKYEGFPGEKYKVALGPPVNGFYPKISVSEENSGKKLDDFVNSCIEYDRNNISKFKKLKQTEFKTANGTRAVRVIIQGEEDGKLLRLTSFYFDGPLGKKFEVICSALAESGETFDTVFDASMKTFQLEQ